MKTDKEFIDGIYKKYEEHSNEKKKGKKILQRRIINIAAVLLIAFSLIIVSSDIKEPQSIEEHKEEATISLKKIGSFENFYNIIKENYKTSDLAKEIQLEDTNAINKSEAQELQGSRTNTQVENVDEADIVKVLDGYIYYISEQKIVIIKAENGKESEKISEINYKEKNFSPEEIYVNKNKLIVIGNNYETNTRKVSTDNICYDIARIYDQKSKIIIYDITDKNNPKETRKVDVDGNYISSRMIGNNIYCATSKSTYNSNILKNEIQDLNEKDYMPQYKDTAISEEEKCIDYNRIYCFEKTENTNYLMLIGLNIENNQEIDIQTFLGAGEYMYCSEKNMYIATIKYEEETTTHLLKFNLENGKIKFSAETNIDGQINNQFSMDENGEYFRIATTTGNIWNMDENTSNNLYVLNEKLEQIGKVTGFGKEERIYSVRYVGDKAYVVTFKQTDPLFVIDLTSPSNPEILGELKLPGYSTYLHPYDENHIIGFGYDTKENGKQVTTNGLKMVMFDVSDLTNPVELFKVAVADKNSSSELIYNHKALLYSKENNIIGFPIGTYSNKKSISKAVIYDIDLEKGFSLKGEITSNSNKYQERIERIVFVNDNYYTLSKSVIKVVDMNSFEMVKNIEI